MPVELGSFDAIIDMDWLAECIQRNQENVTRLNIISCTKTQKYMEKGFPIFLAHVTAKVVEDKSEKKRLENVPIVFPEDLSGLPPTRQQMEGSCPTKLYVDPVPHPGLQGSRVSLEIDLRSGLSPTEGLMKKTVEAASELVTAISTLKQEKEHVHESLALLKGKARFIAYATASKEGLGVVLTQRGENVPKGGRSRDMEYNLNNLWSDPRIASILEVTSERFGYVGVYHDSDVRVMRPLNPLLKMVGLEDESSHSNLNRAVMAVTNHIKLKSLFVSYLLVNNPLFMREMLW
ncbi:hypothetical protein Tco_0556356 [Tanacetum coccineum]